MHAAVEVLSDEPAAQLPWTVLIGSGSPIVDRQSGLLLLSHHGPVKKRSGRSRWGESGQGLGSPIR